MVYSEKKQLKILDNMIKIKLIDSSSYIVLESTIIAYNVDDLITFSIFVKLKRAGYELIISQ